MWGVGSSILGCCRAERRKLTYQCPWLPHLINIMSLRCLCKAAWLALSNAEGAGCGVTGCWEAQLPSQVARQGVAKALWEHVPSFRHAPHPRCPCTLCFHCQLRPCPLGAWSAAVKPETLL